MERRPAKGKEKGAVMESRSRGQKREEEKREEI
jgi:hypothetical protein